MLVAVIVGLAVTHANDMMYFQSGLVPYVVAEKWECLVCNITHSMIPEIGSISNQREKVGHDHM